MPKSESRFHFSIRSHFISSFLGSKCPFKDCTVQVNSSNGFTEETIGSQIELYLSYLLRYLPFSSVGLPVQGQGRDRKPDKTLRYEGESTDVFQNTKWLSAISICKLLGFVARAVSLSTEPLVDRCQPRSQGLIPLFGNEVEQMSTEALRSLLLIMLSLLVWFVCFLLFFF